MKYIRNILKEIPKIKESDIGIICPYKKQVRKLSLRCQDVYSGILIGTVEQFQGLEKSVIIISTVRSQKKLNKETARNLLGFLTNPKVKKKTCAVTFATFRTHWLLISPKTVNKSRTE